MATPGMDFVGGGRGGLNSLLAGGLPGGGSIQDLIAQLQGRLGEGSPQPGGGRATAPPMRGGPVPPSLGPPMTGRPVPVRTPGGDDGDAPMSTQPVPVGINGSPRNQVPTPDRPPSPGGGGLPYKEPPAPEPQEAEPPKMGGTDDDFRNIPDNPPEEMKPRETAMQRASRISRQAPSGPRRTASPGLQGQPSGGPRAAAVLDAKPARKLDPSGRQPPGPRGSKGPVLGAKPAQKPGGPQVTTLPAPAPDMKFFPSTGLKGGPQLAQKPAQVPAEESPWGDLADTNFAARAQKVGFESLADYERFRENRGGDNALGRLYDEALGGGGGTPQVDGKWHLNNPGGGPQVNAGNLTEVTGDLAGQMTPEKLWAIQNAPPWAQKMGAGADEVLRFIRNNPDSPIAQKYAAAGLG